MPGIFDDLVTIAEEKEQQPSAPQNETRNEEVEQHAEARELNAKNFYGEEFKSYFKVR